MNHDFQRVALVSRSAAAMRFILAVREFNQEHNTQLRTIALYTENDRQAMFVREADEAVLLAAASPTGFGIHPLKRSHFDLGQIKRALQASGAEALWAGWDVAAQHLELADLCRDLGIVFIGAEADLMRRLADRIAANRLAEQAQIPVVPWSGGPVETLTEAKRQAKRLGYPLLVKAASGDGGQGVRCVYAASELPDAFESARTEAFEAFGNPTVFIEQLVQAARHAEVQIVADHDGTTWSAGVRDCTIQFRHQRVLVEAPSPALSAEQDQAVREAAVKFSQAIAYSSVGTVVFLHQPKTQAIWFLEMNPGLTVEHAVTECTSQIDLVKLQLHVARGGRLEGKPPVTTGHAIQVRLTVKEPHNSVDAAHTTIQRMTLPNGPGIRIDTGVAEGDAMPPDGDAILATIGARGQDRKEAISRLQRALRQTVVVVKGGESNKAFLLELLNRTELQRGEVEIGWLDRVAASSEHSSRQFADIALIAAAIEAYDAELAAEQARFYASAARGRPRATSEVGHTVELIHRGQSHSIKTYRLGPQSYRVEEAGVRLDARIDRAGRFEYWLTALGQRFHIVSVVEGRNCRFEVDGLSHSMERGGGGLVRVAAPAVVVSVMVKAGDQVAAGDRVAVLEAMKMETVVFAPFAGTVRQVMVLPNVQVDTGTPLLWIESHGDDAAVASERVILGASLASRPDAKTFPSRCRQSLEELRQFILGFDVDPHHSAVLLADWSRHCPAYNDEIIQIEDEILSIFVDNCSLFDRQPEGHDLDESELPSAETCLFSYLSYLRTLETRGEGLPPAFVASLSRALAHYGVSTLDQSPELEESLLWIFRSHQRVEQQTAQILSLLERRLRSVHTLAPHAPESFRTLLERMIATTRGFSTAVSDMAREVRYRYFDQQGFEAARKQVYAQVEQNLAYLAANPAAADRSEKMAALVECPQPLIGMFAGRFQDAPAASGRLMLEALTSRYYRIRSLTGFRSLDLIGHGCVTAEYDYEWKRIHVFSTHAEYSRIPEAARALFALIEQVPADHDVVIDFYVWHTGQSGEPEAVQEAVCSMINQAGFPRSMRRIVVALGQASESSVSRSMCFTYRPGESGYQEEKLYRGIHPMIVKRLHLWRLSKFNIERLPSVEDVYLLRCVALENPKDERLFACAEVRDLTPVRNSAGRIIQLPHLERMLTEALAGIRLFQSRRLPHERLYWNRILLYVWPPFHLTPGELQDIVKRLAPATEGLGLEQVVVRARIPNPKTGELRDTVVRISSPDDSGFLMTFRPAERLEPIKPLTEYEKKVVRMRQRGLVYPYEIIKMLTSTPEDAPVGFPPGDFAEHDLDPKGRLVPVIRTFGQNTANIVVGVIRNFTPKYPEGMRRVLLLGDPSKELGSIAEPECRRILAALELARLEEVPLEWFPISAGAKISMESGVENMDWVARVLRSLIEFTQAGCEVNLVVNGINVGAQPYWNAEATMLMHTKGILIMTPKAAMVLTGKRALEYSGSISAEDNQGIGGYDRIMGVNGQAQYWARDIDEACHILLRHYDHTYIVPGERTPRRAATTDPINRDVQLYPHGGNGEAFTRVGQIFSDQTNPGRKKAFDIRKVMKAVVDQDHSPLERWSSMRGAETAVVWDAHLGGFPVCMIGIESQPVSRLGFIPSDGPDQWTGGTLFPLSSKKVARALNAATNNRPVILLANLSGFDGSPESLRKLQLEYGAEIGRAVVNFKGPMVFCVINRYHGGAYVVFSRALNENLEVAALEGTYASVIGGAPAAAVVFAGEVVARTRKDERLLALSQAMAQVNGAEKVRLQAQWDDLFKVVHSEKLGQLAAEFDGVHSVQRALQVGALHRIIPPANLRPYLIHAIESAVGMEIQSAPEMQEVKMA